MTLSKTINKTAPYTAEQRQDARRLGPLVPQVCLVWLRKIVLVKFWSHRFLFPTWGGLFSSFSATWLPLWFEGLCQAKGNHQELSRSIIFLDALASLDFKLSVSNWCFSGASASLGWLSILFLGHCYSVRFLRVLIPSVTWGRLPQIVVAFLCTFSVPPHLIYGHLWQLFREENMYLPISYGLAKNPLPSPLGQCPRKATTICGSLPWELVSSPSLWIDTIQLHSSLDNHVRVTKYPTADYGLCNISTTKIPFSPDTNIMEDGVDVVVGYQT